MCRCISMKEVWGLGARSPRNFFEIKCSEIASEAILGHRQILSSYIARGALDSILLSTYALAIPVSREKVLKLTEQQVGSHNYKDN